jgi:PAS domain S-box-containing protein
MTKLSSIRDLRKIQTAYGALCDAEFDKNAVETFEKEFDSVFDKDDAVKLIVEPGSGQIIKANLAACNFYGYEIEEMLKKKITEINKLSEEEVIIEFNRQKKEGRDYFNNRQQISSGELRKVEVRSATVFCRNKKCFYFLIHEAESESKQKNIHLDMYNKMTSEMNTDLHDTNKLMISEGLELIEKNARDLIMLTSKLAESENMLRELNASKDRFFSIISHDIKNHFAAILGLSRLLVKPEYNDDYEKRIETATNLHESSKKLYSLLENLLEWAKLQRDELVMEPADFNIHDVAQEAVDLIGLKAETKKISITNNIDSRKKVFADKNMIKTVLRNLLSNAVNFTENGGSVTLESELEGNEMIISVKDNGIGINPESIHKLFRIDEKVINRNTEGGKGTGLGLILCREFIEKNGGNMWVESEESKGSAFSFSLPILPPRKKQNGTSSLNVIDFTRLN